MAKRAENPPSSAIPPIFPVNADRLTPPERETLEELNRYLMNTRGASNRLRRDIFYSNATLFPILFLNELNESFHEEYGGFWKQAWHYSFCQEMEKFFGNEDFMKQCAAAHFGRRRYTVAEGRRDVLDYVARSKLSDRGRQYVRDYMEAEFERVELFWEQMQRAQACDLLGQWADGKLSYRSSMFRSEEEIETFTDHLYRFLHPSVTKEGKKAGNTLNMALDSLQERLTEYERVFWRKEQEREREKEEREARNGREKEAALCEKQRLEEARAAEEQRRQAEMAEVRRREAEEQARQPQPYIFNSAVEGILTRAAAVRKTTSEKAAGAEIFLEAVYPVREQMDVRDPEMQRFGDLLFSAGPVSLLAQALGFGEAVQATRMAEAAAGQCLLPQLRRLYQTSAEVRSRVNTLLDQSENILLLAALTGDAALCTNYANTVLATRRNLERVEAKGAHYVGESCRAMEQRARLRSLLAGRLRSELERTDNGMPAPETFETVTRAAEFPDWLTARLGSHFNARAESGVITVSSLSCPEETWTFKARIPEAEGIKQFSGFCERCDLNARWRDARNELLEAGFSSRSNPALLYHPWYDLSALEEGNLKTRLSSAACARDWLESKKIIQESLIEMAELEGLEVTRQDGCFAFRHPLFPPLALGERGYLTDDEQKKVERLLQCVRQAEAEKQTVPVAVPREEPVVEKSAPLPEFPEEEQHYLIFDANALLALAAPRGKQGHSWLDLLKQTARLPNVKIIIPSVVADWELRGRTARMQGGEVKTEQVLDSFVDPTNPKSETTYALDRFLRTATRARRTAAGTVEMIEGANRNIIIWETAGDSELYGFIDNIMKEEPPHRRWQLMNSEIWKQGEGEKAMERVVQELPWHSPVFFVTSDMKYLRPRLLKTTPHGQPVSGCTLGSYLKAELVTRGGALKENLREEGFLSLRSICDSLNEYWSDYRGQEKKVLYCYHDKGAYADPAQVVKTLPQVLCEGLAHIESHYTARAEHVGNGEENGEEAHPLLMARALTAGRQGQQRPSA